MYTGETNGASTHRVNFAEIYSQALGAINHLKERIGEVLARCLQTLGDLYERRGEYSSQAFQALTSSFRSAQQRVGNAFAQFGSYVSQQLTQENLQIVYDRCKNFVITHGTNLLNLAQNLAERIKEKVSPLLVQAQQAATTLANALSSRAQGAYSQVRGSLVDIWAHSGVRRSRSAESGTTGCQVRLGYVSLTFARHIR